MILTNQELAEIFDKIADLLEIKGEVIYKTLAYRKAAESLRSLAEDAAVLHGQNRLTEIPGVGKAISEKISELLTTGKLGFLQKLEQEVPPTLTELLQVQDVGPRKVNLFWKQAGVTTLAELEAAARAGKLRDLPGMGEKSEGRVLEGIEALEQLRVLWHGYPIAVHVTPSAQAAHSRSSRAAVKALLTRLDGLGCRFKLRRCWAPCL